MLQTFEEFCEAHYAGKLESHSYSGSGDWDLYKNDPKIEKVLLWSDDTQKIKLFRVFSNVFLVDYDNKYLGFMQFKKWGESTLHILASNSIFRGFYKLVFGVLLTKYDNLIIFSGDNLSEDAIKAYEKLHSSNAFSIMIKIGTELHDFSRETLLQTPSAIVRVSNKH